MDLLSQERVQGIALRRSSAKNFRELAVTSIVRSFIKAGRIHDAKTLLSRYEDRNGSSDLIRSLRMQLHPYG